MSFYIKAFANIYAVTFAFQFPLCICKLRNCGFIVKDLCMSVLENARSFSYLPFESIKFIKIA
jgi:hypothetical protein